MVLRIVSKKSDSKKSRPENSVPQVLFAIAISTFTLVACDSGGGDAAPVAPAATPVTLSVTPSLGKMSGAQVFVRCLATGADVGTGTLNSAGNVDIVTTAPCTGPVLVRVLADSSTTYFDEAANGSRTVPPGVVMRAMLPSLTANRTVAVTPFTEAATRRVITVAGDASAATPAQVNAANAGVVATLLGAGETLDILTPPRVWDRTPAPGSLGNSAADRYAFYLAAMAQLGVTATYPAFAAMNAIGDDINDGNLSGATTTHVNYTAGNFATKWAAALQANAGYASNALKSAVGISTGGSGGSGSALGEANGFEVAIGGHTWVLNNAEVYRFSVGGHREMNFEMSAPDVTPFNGNAGAVLNDATIVVAAQAAGVQTCGGNISISLSVYGAGNGAGIYTATSCSIDVQYMSARGAIAGVITSATLQNPSGQTVQLTDAPFRVYRHIGPGAAKTSVADNSRISMFIDAGTFELPQGREFQLQRADSIIGSAEGASTATPDGTTNYTGNASNNIVFNIQNASGFFTGARTYNCGESITAGNINLQLYMGTYQAEYGFFSALAGGSCVINITQKNQGYYSGTYTATLIGDPAGNPTLPPLAERTLQISGELRNFRIDPYAPHDAIDTQALAADGASMTVTDGNIVFNNGDDFVASESSVSLQTTSFDFNAAWGDQNNGPRWDDYFVRDDNGFEIRMRAVPRAVGVYQCGTAYGGLYPYLFLNTERVGNLSATLYNAGAQDLLSGGNCTITVSDYDVATGTITGTYTASLVNADLAAVVPGGDAALGITGSFQASGLTLQ